MIFDDETSRQIKVTKSDAHMSVRHIFESYYQTIKQKNFVLFIWSIKIGLLMRKGCCKKCELHVLVTIIFFPVLFDFQGVLVVQVLVEQLLTLHRLIIASQKQVSKKN